MNFVDTHCHIHDPEFAKDCDQDQKTLLEEAKTVGVDTIICVGTSEESSLSSVEFCKSNKNCFASLALHPHEVETYTDEELDKQMETLAKLATDKSVVAIGETGLDYFYHDDPATHRRQKHYLEQHIKLALKHDLPLVFHVRDKKGTNTSEIGSAFEDFFEVVGEYEGIKGVVHSFSGGLKTLQKALDKGLYIGINGIITFTNDKNQLEAVRTIPASRLLLETDAPFLTPAPFRGTICKPKHLRVTAEFLSTLRDESLEALARETTNNAKQLFRI